MGEERKDVLQKTNGNVRRSIDEPHDPLVAITGSLVGTVGEVVWNTELFVKGQISTVGACKKTQSAY